MNLTIGNTNNQNLLREHGHIKTVVALMKSESSKTRQNACWLLKKLATNNQKNRDHMRELGTLENLVPLMALNQTSELQEHAVALLAFLLDKHTRNRMQFKDIQGGPAALSALHDSVAGTGTRTEEFCGKCIESLGGIKSMTEDKTSSSGSRNNASSNAGGSSSSTSSGHLQVPSSANKSPAEKVRSPRGGETSSPRRLLSPRSPREKKKSIFSRNKKDKGDKGSDEEDPMFKTDGRRSVGEDEIDGY